MPRSWFLIGTIAYVALIAAVFPFLIGVPVFLTYGSDAIGYSTGAINLLLHGFYSFDGLTPFLDREPGMSLFLVPIYFVFGIENPIGLYVVQGILFYLATLFFSRETSRSASPRAAGICFLLLLTSGSVFHTIFSAYRECLALMLLLSFSGLFLSHKRHASLWKILLMGLLFGALILTYYSFVFFPPVLLFIWWRERRSVKEALAVILVCYIVAAFWALRNESHDGKFRVIDDRRTTVMWYVRGEQAERVRGLEPLWCLWAEYVSRDWTGRSDACSFNALMHRRWPEDPSLMMDDSNVLQESQAKLRANVGSYFWFSLFEILELHLPFLGGGWSHRYNVYAAFTALFMYIGCVMGLHSFLRSQHSLWILLAGYHTMVFILTDATPRYLLPVIFCYALMSGIGYDWALKRLFKRSS